MQFTHLHMHTEYSLLDGANRLEELVKKTKELGMDSLAITDHGNMFGVIELYKICKEYGIKLIVGCEMYMAPRSRLDKEGKIDTEPYHLVLLAMNQQGYNNLIKLVSISYTEGFYYKPRIDMEVLKKYQDNLICLSGCLAGELSRNIIQNNVQGAELKAKEFLDIFGKERYYLELQNNGINDQVLVNQNLIKIGQKLEIGIVATNDCHYLTKQDYEFHEVLLCIQTKKTMADQDRMKFPTNEFYVKSPQEMQEAFKNLPQAIANTQKIVDNCNVTFEFGKIILPEFKNDQRISNLEYFNRLCQDGIEKKYDSTNTELINKVKERLNYETSVIEQMGYIDYFLIVQDFVNFAKSQDIPVGPGRGSGAGSIAAYLIGITDIDPLKYNLIFERFLNPERITMPDFDIDFCYERRGEVIDYVTKKYGSNHVAQIITFGTMAAKAAIRDIARVLDVPYSKADQIAKMVPQELKMTIDKAIEQNTELKERYVTDMEARKIIDFAKQAEGMPRHASTHAAGIVITKEPVDYYVPVCLNQNSVSTQYTMGALEELGLLKMDFLGLRTLTVIKDAMDMIKNQEHKNVVFDENLSDPKVYQMLCEGKTTGVFQLESEGFRKMMKELKPDCLEDITVMLSLYRPGPMDQIPKYIKSKNNPDLITYTHDSLKSILQVTNGCMVYQEQVMQIFRDLAGYSFAKADLVRRAMGKKKIDVMNKEREVFVRGAKKRGIDETSSNKIFDEMAEFAKYAFNKSHAASYAVISYQTAYLKVYYPAYFMAATMNSMLGNLNKIPEYIVECQNLNILVEKPNINESYTKFKVENENIIFALETIKNISENAINEIIQVREKGKFTGFIDFIQRVAGEHVNKKCIESLIKAGAFDQVEKEYNRYDLLENYESLIDSMINRKRTNYINQIDFFGEITEEKTIVLVKSKRELTVKDMLKMEKEILGMYVSGHPLDEYKEYIQKNATITTKGLVKEENEQELIELDSKIVTMCGIVSSSKIIYTKSNKTMMFCELSDHYGVVECILFSGVFEKLNPIFSVDNVVCIKGKITVKEGEACKIIVLDAEKITKSEKIYIKIPQDKLNLEKIVIDFVKQLSDEYYGNIPVYVYLEGTSKVKTLTRDYWLDGSSQVMNHLKERLGEQNIKKI